MQHATIDARILTAAAGLALAALCTPLALAGGDGVREHGKEELAAARAQAAAGFDEETGRNLRVYPRDRVVDLEHMKLEILIPDMNKPRLSGTETLTMRAFASPVDRVTLDAKAMTITSVSVQGRQASFDYDGEHLTISLSPPLAPAQQADLVMSYELNDPPLGLVWTPESPEWPDRPAQIHSQGQAEDNSYWFPTHDFPNERLTTELIVTVPTGYTVSSNGHLAGRDQRIIPEDELVDFGVKSLQPYDVFHWVQDKPHVPYLVSMVVGKFDVLDVNAGGGVPMPVYVPPGRAGDVPASYGHTPEMVSLFGRLFDEPYPWDRYAQLTVWNFGAGGMENTSCTTLYATAIVAPDEHEDNDLDGLISHELGHQWFGDLMTCNSWEHIWLNEGFATYCSALWTEHRDGREAYIAQIRGDMDGIIAGDHADAPAQVGMCSKVYADPWEVFRRRANPYGKGASILHMLRTKLGDELFFKGVALYIDRHKLQTVETSDLERALEEVSGQSLDQFFSQWTTRPGVPHVDVRVAWDRDARVLKVSAEQTQTIDGDNPAFEFDLPVYVQTSANPGSGSRRVLSMRGKSAEVSVPADAEPVIVAVDPDLSVLADLDIEQPASRWATQLTGGPTFASRIQAARALGHSSDTRHAELLRRIAVDAGEPVSLRVEAVHALTARGSEVDVRSLVTTARDRWEVREAVTNALPDLLARDEFKDRAAMRASIAEVLSERSQREDSSRVRAASLRALGRIKAVEYVPVVLAALDENSQNDQVRQAALDALADLDAADGLTRAMQYARPGVYDRTRAVAINAIARLAHQDHDAAYTFLVPLLKDREAKTSRAAAEALITIGDQRAVAELEALAKAQRTNELRKMVNDWVTRLKDKAEKKG